MRNRRCKPRIHCPVGKVLLRPKIGPCYFCLAKNNESVGKFYGPEVNQTEAIEMAFFGKSLESKRIRIDDDAVNSDSPEMKKRLDRIEGNYAKLDGILNELEARFELDERLTASAEKDLEEIKKKPR